MALHLPALGKLTALLHTPKGRKTLLLAGGGVGAVVLGLRAKKKGGLSTTQTDPAQQGLDTASTPTSGGGFTFPDGSQPFPDAGVASGGAQTVADPSTGFDPGGFSSAPLQFFQGSAPLSLGDQLGLPAGTPSGPDTAGFAVGSGLTAALAGVRPGGVTPQVTSIAAVGGAGKGSVLSDLDQSRTQDFGFGRPVFVPAPATNVLAGLSVGTSAAAAAPPPPAPPPPPPVVAAIATGASAVKAAIRKPPPPVRVYSTPSSGGAGGSHYV